MTRIAINGEGGLVWEDSIRVEMKREVSERVIRREMAWGLQTERKRRPVCPWEGRGIVASGRVKKTVDKVSEKGWSGKICQWEGS
jgi:hypothetical protein